MLASNDMPDGRSSLLETRLAENYLLVCGAIVFVAAVLRAHNLGGTSLWLDEAVYANNAMRPFGEMFDWTRHRNSSPILLPFLLHLFGDQLRNPAVARALPMLFGTGSVVLLLALRRVGVPATVTTLAALLLAVHPHEIEYSQEVREYSLSGLATCAILYASLGHLRRPTSASLTILCAVMLAVPFAAYGSIFAALALLGASLGLTLSKRRSVRLSMLLPWAFLGTGALASWMLTARYQLGLAKSAYLLPYYPPDGLRAGLGWATRSVADYSAYAAGDTVLVPAAVCLVAAAGVRRALGRVEEPGLELLLAGLVLLIAGSLAAAFLGLYPFGAIRNHLFAVPLIVLCVSWSAVYIAALLNRSTVPLFLFGVAIAFVFVSVRGLPRVYAERQDIVSAVEVGLRGVPDDQVYVYHAAGLALAYHFPDRSYIRGSYLPGDSATVAREANDLVKGCTLHLLFSHVYNGHDDDIIAALGRLGAVLARDRRFEGARVAALTRCPDGQQ